MEGRDFSTGDSGPGPQAGGLGAWMAGGLEAKGLALGKESGGGGLKAEARGWTDRRKPFPFVL